MSMTQETRRVGPSLVCQILSAKMWRWMAITVLVFLGLSLALQLAFHPYVAFFAPLLVAVAIYALSLVFIKSRITSLVRTLAVGTSVGLVGASIAWSSAFAMLRPHQGDQLVVGIGFALVAFVGLSIGSLMVTGRIAALFYGRHGLEAKIDSDKRRSLFERRHTA